MYLFYEDIESSSTHMVTWYSEPQVITRITPTSSTLPIVGRQRELALVKSQYEAARYGRVGVVLISGEPGIGKTRLLDEIAQLALQDGATVLRGGASEAEGMPPYLPFLEALGQHIRVTPLECLRTQLAVVPQVLASILPELSSHLSDLLVPHQLSPEQTRLRLYESIGTFLEVIGVPHVLVLTLDDLHWADSATLDLLCHIARRQSNAHLLILGAYRDSEVSHNPLLARSVAELSRQRVLTAMTVNPLSALDIQDLAINALGGTLSPELIALLYTQSEGNPFFAEELLHNWLEMGVLVQENSRWAAVTSLEHALPPSIVGALRQRFTRLSTEIIDHLRVAAIIGRTFDLALLATVEGTEIEALEECLLEAVSARLVRSDQAGSYSFSHDKIRECLYVEVSTSRRQRLHGIIGQVLEAQGTMGAGQLNELAFHFARSNDKARCIDYSLRAAVLAVQASATGEAIAHYQTALKLLGPDDGRRGDVLLGLNEAALLDQKVEETEASYAAAQDSGSAQEKTPQASLPARLTQREVMVLTLVAQGKSNRQIAQMLKLSEKTVANHLSHIFEKTGSENRAAATAFAIHHGLA